MATLLPDALPALERWGLYGGGVRLLKFAVLSLFGCAWAHVFGKYILNEEYDKAYTVREFWQVN